LAAHFFCPKCWKEIDGQTVKCPHCGYDISKHASLSYEEKLINTLNHPIDDSRMLAIKVLGDLRSQKAVPIFASILETEEDFYTIREIILSLDKIGGTESKNLIRQLHTHRSKLVRMIVEQIMPDLQETLTNR
jgi:HEAT repeat protein